LSLNKLRVAFAGTPDFAAVALQALLDAGAQVPLVLTQPDRPAGRGLKLQASPVKQLALQHSIAVAQPLSLRLDGKYPQDAAQAQAALQAAQCDVMVVAAYGLILPLWTLQLPRLGCLNIHASLLPRWRGAAPIHRAIEAGDAQTGITIMQMDEGLDTGDMLALQAEPIAPTDTTGSLHDRLAILGGRLLIDTLQALLNGTAKATSQPAEGATYAEKICKTEAVLDWSQSANILARQVRAFNPFPGAHTLCEGEVLKVWQAHAEPGNSSQPHGTVLHAGPQGVSVQTGNGVLLITQLQSPGGKRLAAADWLRGHTLQLGMVLGLPSATV
jgi:methionyl-tRNA formyltransferase